MRRGHHKPTPCSTSEAGRESACILSTDERSSQGGKVTDRLGIITQNIK